MEGGGEGSRQVVMGTGGLVVVGVDRLFLIRTLTSASGRRGRDASA